MNDSHRQLLAFVAEFCDANGYSPTLNETARGSGLRWINSVARRAKALREAGLLTWEPNQSRTMRVTAAGIAALTCGAGA